jgi:hypothetical protein
MGFNSPQFVSVALRVIAREPSYPNRAEVMGHSPLEGLGLQVSLLCDSNASILACLSLYRFRPSQSQSRSPLATAMSLQVNLSSPDIANAYQDILNGRGIDWVVLTYEKASNDLRVQSTGNGLEDLEEEFSDGR